jgi:hypothetical protein
MDQKPNLQETYNKLLVGAKIKILVKNQSGEIGPAHGILMDKYLVTGKGEKDNVFIDILLGNGIIIEYYAYYSPPNRANVVVLT